MRPFRSSALPLLGLLAVALSACSAFSGAESPAAASGAEPGDPGAPPGPKAPEVEGPADPSELTNELGVFVAATGRDDADGSLEHPLARIQAGIELGRKTGKRVYVCTGTYREQLVLADSISVIGGLDCSQASWKTGAPQTIVESPLSPAVRAKDLVTPTRLESLAVIAPAATAPGGSSIALVAEHSPALVVASSRLVAGDAAKGEDGVEGTQLVNDATADGSPSIPPRTCELFSCVSETGTYMPPNTPAGANTCGGVPGFVAPRPGGYGGSGGKYQRHEFRLYLFEPHPSAAYAAKPGVHDRTSSVGESGPHGSNAPALGAFSVDGYVPADGAVGTSGKSGDGGEGGDGRAPPAPAGEQDVTVMLGDNGASGGAGGCPGLAGTAGKGGGASIAALLLDSAITLDGSTLVGGRGGDAGAGTLGSTPTDGGKAGPNPSFLLTTIAKPGGRGGAAGFSGNGATGPSLGVVHLGPAPKLVGATKITPGTGGSAIAERSRTDAFGTTVTIPATPAGIAKDLLAL